MEERENINVFLHWCLNSIFHKTHVQYIDVNLYQYT